MNNKSYFNHLISYFRQMIHRKAAIKRLQMYWRAYTTIWGILPNHNLDMLQPINAEQFRKTGNLSLGTSGLKD